MSERRPAVVSLHKARRHRARPTPKWLLQKEELNQIAQRRTLMILSVLSGETPVTDAIEKAQISRGHYYQLEERALQAILEAMEPGAAPGRPPDTSTRLLQFEERVKQLEADKRRLERLLSMTRKVLRKGPMKTTLGRPGSGKAGKSASQRSKLAAKMLPGSASPISSSDPNTR
jgi:hypothetical protein